MFLELLQKPITSLRSPPLIYDGMPCHREGIGLEIHVEAPLLELSEATDNSFEIAYGPHNF